MGGETKALNSLREENAWLVVQFQQGTVGNILHKYVQKF